MKQLVKEAAGEDTEKKTENKKRSRQESGLDIN